MKFFEKHPMWMIVIGVLGISMSAIFVKYSTAPSDVTAAYRLLWTVLLLSPAVFGNQKNRRELLQLPRGILLLSILSGIFLAIHFALWFESLKHTTVASSTTIVCTEVIWVCLGFCLFMKGKLSWKALIAIAVTLSGSVLIAYSDSGSHGYFYGDMLALLAAVAVAVYTLIGRAVMRKDVSTTVYTYVVYTACAVSLLVSCLAQQHSLVGHGYSAVIVGLLLAVFSTILGHSVFSWCLKYFSPSFVSASKLCEPVVAAIMAGFLFQEIPSWVQICGGILILGGVFYYSLVEARK